MAKSIKLQKTVLRKDEFDKVVDSSFKSFVDQVPQQDTDTVQELFRLYDKLYYEIPIEGERNSHEFLIKESSKLYTLEQTNEDIKPLLDEIAELRQRILELNQEMLETQTAALQNGHI